jgi:TonB family protein
VSLEQFKTQVLLLHSQQSTLDNLSTGFSDRYSVHFATSGTEALLTLGETPIDIIVSAQDLPGMSGLEALREAKKRSPDMVGILLAGNDDDGLEAMVGDKEVFQIVRGAIEPDALFKLVESVHRQARLLALAESANDHSAGVDESAAEHIVMETSENGATIISDGTGRFPGLKPEKIQISPGTGGRDVDVLVLTKDEEFLATIKDSARGLHNVHHAVTTSRAEDYIGKNKIGVLVTDAAMADDSVESLTKQLRKKCPRLVAIVAGRRDDGEMLMDLINRGHVYRFLLKPVSPGRARLAIEASVKHHIEAPEEAFKPKSGSSFFSRKDSKADAKARAETDARRKAEEKAEAEAKRKAEEKARAEAEAKRKAEEKARAEAEAKRKAEEKARAEAEAKRKAEEKARAEAEAKRRAEEEAKAKAEAERKAREEEEARRKAEAEARRRAEKEAKAKAEEEARRKAEEEARRKAEEEARRRAEEEKRAEAERRAREKAEAKARAKAEAEAKKRAKAEAKAKARAEAAAKKQARAEAKARARAEADARARAEAEQQRLEPSFDDNSFDAAPDDGLDHAFSETSSFTDTMTDIASAVGSSVAGAAGSVAVGAHDILATLGDAEPAWKNPRTIAIGGGAIVAIAAVGWFLFSGESVPDSEVPVDTTAALPAAAEPAGDAEPVQPAPAFEPGTAAVPGSTGTARVPYAAGLERARGARRAGDLMTPPGGSAIELYAAIAADAAGDPEFDSEFAAVVNDVLAVAERAILAGNADQADSALSMARVADPGNSRLDFLRAQVDELLLRDRAERARVAIRVNRFEDAGRLIAEARSFTAGDSGEIDLLTEELNTARSQQQVGETIATAKARLDSGRLISPANDNARYYFELALSNDPQNLAAQQGLIAVASKLVLQARDSIDAGRLDDAERLLDDAAELDSGSAELAAAVAVLGNEREAIAQAARRAEAERQAEIERQAELRRQEEARLKAEAERRERDRIAAEQREAAAAQQAEQDAEQQANRVATASPLGVGAAAPKQVIAAESAPPASSRTSAPEPRPEPRVEPPVRQQPVQAGVAINRQAAAQVQRQSASAINVQTPAAQRAGSVVAPSEPEIVPISQLTRINYVGPEYPRAARRRNVTGAVDIGFTVTTDGRVRAVSVISSDPGDTFDQAAMEAVEQWRFEPVIENGVAVEKRSAVRLSFNLN